MDDKNVAPGTDDGVFSPERRSLLRNASMLLAGATVGNALAGAARAQTPANGSAPLFPGFTAHSVETSGGVSIKAVKAGSGPPVLLLHGAPQSRLTWRDVARELANDYTVVATDLRGYGDSGQPQRLPDHTNYSKRAMALDQVEVMRHFGFERFAWSVTTAAHESRTAWRSIIPCSHEGCIPRHNADTLFVYARDDRLREGLFHWFNYLARPADPRDPHLEQREPRAARQLTVARAEYQRCFGLRPAARDVRGLPSRCLDTTSSTTTRTSTRIHCPLHILWAADGAMDKLYDVLAIWRERAANVTGKGMPGGHNMQEGAPNEVLAELQRFLHA